MITLILATMFPKADWEPSNVWFVAMFEILLEFVVIGVLAHVVVG